MPIDEGARHTATAAATKPKPKPKPKVKVKVRSAPPRPAPDTVDQRRTPRPKPPRLEAAKVRAKPLTRQQELELAVDIFLKRSPGLTRAARASRASGAVRGAEWLFEPIFLEPGKFDPRDPKQLGLLPVEAAIMAPFGRPFRAAAAGAIGAKALFKGAGKEGAKQAAKQSMTGPGVTRRAGSAAAGALAKGAEKVGLPKPIVDYIANAEAKRIFRHEGDEIEAIRGYASSRTGKLVEKAADKARPVTSKLPLIKNEQQMYSRELGKLLKAKEREAMSHMVVLERAIPKGLFRRIRVPDYYALRLMAGTKGTPENAVRFHLDLAQQMEAAGDTLGAKLHKEHATQFQHAAKYVAVDPKTQQLVWTEAAPGYLRRTLRRIEGAAESREEILRELDLLSDGIGEMRVVNEELLYHGARYQDTELYIQRTIQNSPNRQKLLEILTKANPETAETDIDAIDALARGYLERETQMLLRTIENAEKKIAEGGPSADQFTRLRDTAKRRLIQGVDADAFYSNMNDVVQGFPEEVRRAMIERYGDDILFKFDTPELASVARKASANLRAKLNPRNADKGLQVNPTVRRQGMVVTGKVTPKAWSTRVLKVMPSAEERDYWARWYEHFEPTFRAVFGDDADEIMRGFAMSQANTSPAGGLGAVLKVMDRLRKGEEVTSEGIGMIAHAIKDAIEGTPLERGAAAKLSDFTDALALRETRTWMGHAPEGGMPAPTDVWAGRDLGYVDNKFAKRLEEVFGLQQGVHFVIDNPKGAPSGARYERISEQYHAIADHLNKTKFDGRSDWNPAQAQALGWATVQKMVGVDPEDMAFALERNTRRLDFEVTMGPSGLGATEGPRPRAQVVSRIEELEKWLRQNAPHRQDEMYDEGGEVTEVMDELATLKNLLSENDSAALFGVEPPGFGTTMVSALNPEQQAELLRIMEPEARRILESVPGIYVRDTQIGVSGWAQGTNGSMHISVIGTEESVYEAITKLAQAFDQELIQASRQITKAGAKAALVVSSDAFADDSVKLAFVSRLYELVPELQQHGHMPDKLFDQPAFTVATSRGYTSPSTAEDFLARYRGAIEQAEEELGISVRYGTKNLELLIGGQRGRASFDTGAGSLGAGELEDPLAAEVRGRLERAIEAVQRGDAGALRRGVDDGLPSDPTEGRLADIGQRGEPAGPGVPEEDVGEVTAGAVGERLAKALPGYDTAAVQLENGTLPVQFLRELVANTELSHYEKLAIGRHLNKLSGGALRGNPNFENSVPGLMNIIPSEMRLKGLYQSGNHTLYAGSTADALTVWHELTHMMQFEHVFPADFLNHVESFLRIRNGQWEAQNLEDIAHIMEAFVLGYDPTKSKLPIELRDSLLKMKNHLIEDKAYDQHAQKYMPGGEKELPAELRDAVENLMWYEEAIGASFRGAKGYQGRGKLYMPETRGLPVSIMRPWSLSKAYATQFGSMLRRGQASHLRVRDPHLEKQFTGSLIRSGRFHVDVIRGTREVQVKAARINAMAELRQRALKIGKERPERYDDVFVPINLKEWRRKPAAKELRKMSDLLSSLDRSGKISAADLRKLDWQAVEDGWDAGTLGLSKRSEAEARELAQSIIDGVTEPIENGVWVNRQALMDTGMFDPPRHLSARTGTFARSAEWSIDAINDYLKASVLLLNPAYYPMNVVGNSVMLLMQQGPLAPLNIARAAKAHWDLGEDAFLIDHYVGGGLMAPATLAGAFTSGKVSHLLQDVANLIVDRYPRRAAFIYEARKLGYEGTDALRELLTNPELADDLRKAAQRTRDKMVDFDNLSQWEKDVMSRYIFVYPWLKGATVWAARFPKDHPLQSMAYALLYAYQQDALDEAIPGGHPDYMNNWIPLGERERYGETYPWGISGRQLTTFSTPIDIFNTIQGTVRDKDTQPMAEMLNPIYGEIVKQMTGYDTFEHKEVPRGIIPFLNRSFNPKESSPLAKSLERASRSEEERERDAATRLYPTSATEDWTKVFLGSLAPQPVNPEVAQKISHRGPKPPEARLDDWVEKAEKTLGREVPEQIKKLQAARMQYRSSLGNEKHTKAEILALMIDSFAVLYPDRADDAARWREEAAGLSDVAAKPYIEQFRGYLGWDELNEWEKQIAALEKARG